MYALANKVIPLTYLALSPFDIANGYFFSYCIIQTYASVLGFLQKFSWVYISFFLQFCFVRSFFLPCNTETKQCLRALNLKKRFSPAVRNIFFQHFPSPRSMAASASSKLQVGKNLLSLTYTNLMFSLGKKRWFMDETFILNIDFCFLPSLPPFAFSFLC